MSSVCRLTLIKRNFWRFHPSCHVLGFCCSSIACLPNHRDLYINFDGTRLRSSTSCSQTAFKVQSGGSSAILEFDSDELPGDRYVQYNGEPYDGMCSFFGGKPALAEGLGWFIVVGLGAVFSLGVSFCMWLAERAVPPRHEEDLHTVRGSCVLSVLSVTLLSVTLNTAEKWCDSYGFSRRANTSMALGVVLVQVSALATLFPNGPG